MDRRHGCIAAARGACACCGRQNPVAGGWRRFGDRPQALSTWPPQRAGSKLLDSSLTAQIEAMLFFFLAMLSCLLLPWTAAVVWHLLFPGRAEARPVMSLPHPSPTACPCEVAKVFPDTSESGSRVRYCRTQAMEADEGAAWFSVPVVCAANEFL